MWNQSLDNVDEYLTSKRRQPKFDLLQDSCLEDEDIDQDLRHDSRDMREESQHKELFQYTRDGVEERERIVEESERPTEETERPIEESKRPIEESKRPTEELERPTEESERPTEESESSGRVGIERAGEDTGSCDMLQTSNRVVTPKTLSRETSTTNLSIPFIRKAVDRSNSYVGVLPSNTPNKMANPTTPSNVNVVTPSKMKTPNRNIYTFLHQYKSSGMLPLPNNMEERPVGSNVIEKKRLVDQFYNSVNESNMSAPSSSTDLSSMFKSNNSGLPAGTGSYVSPAVEKLMVQTANHDEDTEVDPISTPENGRSAGTSASPISKELTDVEFTQILQNGGYKYEIQNKVDEGLTSYLLNIDNILEDVKAGRGGPGHFGNRLDSTPPETSLEPLLQVMESLSADFQNKSVLFTEDPQISSLNDLNRLGVYLTKLSDSTRELKDQLEENTKSMRTRFRQEIHGNVSRLNELLGELNHLEKRFNTVKSRVNNNKVTMSEDMLEKIEVLEYIDSKFIEHSKITRNTRFKQLNITLVVVILLVGVYYGHK